MGRLYEKRRGFSPRMRGGGGLLPVALGGAVFVLVGRVFGTALLVEAAAHIAFWRVPVLLERALIGDLLGDLVRLFLFLGQFGGGHFPASAGVETDKPTRPGFGFPRGARSVGRV